MRIAPSAAPSSRRAARSEAVILFFVADQVFAISAHSIHEVRSTDSLSSAASEISATELPKVRHRLRRGRKFYYVVNACAHFGLSASRPTLVLVLRGSRVAVLVDRIERMETISLLFALPPAFCGPERAWYRGLTLINDEIVPVVSPSGFLTDSELGLLDAYAPPPESELASGAEQDEAARNPVAPPPNASANAITGAVSE